MYYCKDCARPVEQAIEGELICTDCWDYRQSDIAVARAEKEIEAYLVWAETHCEGCGREGFNGICPECQAEQDAIELEWLEEIGHA